MDLYPNFAFFQMKVNINKMPTQSGDDTQQPTAVAKVYLEDGTVLTGISFGSHTSAEGEVRTEKEQLC
jgi:hypothetical protein